MLHIYTSLLLLLQSLWIYKAYEEPSIIKEVPSMNSETTININMDGWSWDSTEGPSEYSRRPTHYHGGN
jgi:hypothetical protein